MGLSWWEDRLLPTADQADQVAPTEQVEAPPEAPFTLAGDVTGR